MDGEAEPTMRLHLHVSHAVQGELFPSADAQPVTRGYRGTVASKVAGITYRQNHPSPRRTDPAHADCIRSKMW